MTGPLPPAQLEEQAKRLESLGFTVFPAQLTWNEDRQKFDKKPRHAGWQIGIKGDGFHEGDAIGVVQPEGTMTLDLDKPEEFEAFGLPHNGTASQKTNRGKHEFYRLDPAKPKIKNSQHGTHDIKTDGGWIVAWEPDEWVSPDEWAMAPDWVYFHDGWAPSGASKPSAIAPDGTIPNGERHSHYLKLAGVLYNAGMSEDGILAALRAENAKRSSDHDDADLVEIAHSTIEWDQTIYPALLPPPAPPRALRFDELPTGAPPPLLLNRLHPLSHTLLYGFGGAGKGVLVSSWVVRLIKECGMRVLIVDYENNGFEWGARLDGLGLTGKYHEMFRYIPPLDLDLWKGAQGPLWDLVADIRAVVAEDAIDYMVVDSVAYACGVADSIDQTTATRYSSAITQIGLPTLSIGHVTKTKDHSAPFGSAFWHNGARMTWSLEDKNGAKELHHRKGNNYRMQPPYVVTSEWSNDKPVRVTEEPLSETIWDQIVGYLTWHSPNGDGTVKDIKKHLDSVRDKPVSESQIRSVLSKHADEAHGTGPQASRVYRLGAKSGALLGALGSAIDGQGD